MDAQIPLGSDSLADNPKADAKRDDHTRELLSDLAYKRLGIVNVAFYGKANAGDGAWVLIDAGVAGTAGTIRRAAEERFGKDARPAAIIMTHGHFDHAGGLETLAKDWDVPIYAHELELPYLNGTASYPPPDPSVGGGLMALLSPMYPRSPYDVSRWLEPLPAEGTVPHMPGWKWIHVPGHTPGQVALWRAGDLVLLPADAFITTRQESAYAVTVQKPELPRVRPRISRRIGRRRASPSRNWPRSSPSSSSPATAPRCRVPKCAPPSSSSRVTSRKSPFRKKANTCASRRRSNLAARIVPRNELWESCASSVQLLRFARCASRVASKTNVARLSQVASLRQQAGSLFYFSTRRAA